MELSFAEKRCNQTVLSRTDRNDRRFAMLKSYFKLVKKVKVKFSRHLSGTE